MKLDLKEQWLKVCKYKSESEQYEFLSDLMSLKSEDPSINKIYYVSGIIFFTYIYWGNQRILSLTLFLIFAIIFYDLLNYLIMVRKFKTKWR